MIGDGDEQKNSAYVSAAFFINYALSSSSARPLNHRASIVVPGAFFVAAHRSGRIETRRSQRIMHPAPAPVVQDFNQKPSRGASPPRDRISDLFRPHSIVERAYVGFFLFPPLFSLLLPWPGTLHEAATPLPFNRRFSFLVCIPGFFCLLYPTWLAVTEELMASASPSPARQVDSVPRASSECPMFRARTQIASLCIVPFRPYACPPAVQTLAWSARRSLQPNWACFHTSFFRTFSDYKGSS